ncbi:rho GTPase-activating protein gacN-like [Dendronephthya gigantea]|uniref:rho GTPase-activating protein gacN-like n=1 Tax=Dendronephthya gigantea TaxID=151771 RepID=UPI00106C8B1C|nr:rho GTPase-activating protein gacN-like [Dendronephthya gigantea]
MEKFQVSLPSPWPCEFQNKNSSEKSYSKACFLKVLLIILFILIISGGFIYLGVEFDKLRGDVKFLEARLEQKSRNDDENFASISRQMKAMNDTEKSLRRFTNEQMNTIQEEIRQMKSPNSSNTTRMTEGNWRPNLKQIQSHLNALLLTVRSLSKDVSRMNVSSDSKLSRLSGSLNAIQNDIILLQNDLAQLNKSVHLDITSFVTSAVDDLRQELNKTITKLRRLSERTDEEIDDIVKLLSQHNETLHFKIAYHSDALLSEVKRVEEKQTKFHNDTAKTLKNIRNELNQTRVKLQQNIVNEISRASEILHKELRVVKDSVGSVRASIKKINASVNGIKNDLKTHVNNLLDKQKKMKKDFAETKAKFQEEHRKYDASNADRVAKMESMKRRIDNLERNRRLDSTKINKQQKEIDDLKREVTGVKNGANRILRADVRLIFLFVCVILGYML